MSNRLQELTDKVYNEGVAKGKDEAEKLIADAKAQADKILSEAQNQANSIVAGAEKSASELSENTASEIRLASKQAVEALKQELTGLITGSISATDIKAATGDVKFIQQAIETAVKNWAINNQEEINMNVLIPSKDEKAITDYFAGVAKGTLDKGFKIESVNDIKSGFQVAPADNSYKVSFTEADFQNFFSEFLRPKVVELLFGK